MCTTDTHPPRAVMVLPPYVGMLNANRPSRYRRRLRLSIRTKGAEADQHKSRGFPTHKVTFKGSKSSANGARGYDYVALSAI